MNQTIATANTDVSEFAPKILTIKIETDKIGALIGPGGKNIKALCERYGVEVNTENDGTVTIYGKNSKAASDAKAAVMGIVEDPEIGVIYKGIVKKVVDFGAFIEILPGKEGLCHVSKLSRQRVANVQDIVKEGQEISVKLLEIDKMGRLNLSYIDALDAESKEAGSVK